MAFTPELYETGLGSDENPWATDSNGNSISIDAGAGSPVVQVEDALDALTATSVTNGEKLKAWATTQGTFTDGTIRSQMWTSHSDSASFNNKTGFMLRTDADTVGIEIGCGPYGTGPERIDMRNYYGSQLAAIDKQFGDETWMEFIAKADGTTMSALLWTPSTLPPASDYKTVTWDLVDTDAAYTSTAGYAGIMYSRAQASQPTSRFRDILAFAEGAVCDGFTVALTPGDTQIEIDITEPGTAYEFRAILWGFLRYKSGSQPTDQDDGTLVTGAGDGYTGIAADGRFAVDDFGSHVLGSLSNGTTYYVRPFWVMADGSIVAGTSQSATPVSPQIILPDADIVTAGWSTAPLFSKVNDASDATYVSSTTA